MFHCFVPARSGEGGNPTGREGVLNTDRIWPGTRTTPSLPVGFPPTE